MSRNIKTCNGINFFNVFKEVEGKKIHSFAFIFEIETFDAVDISTVGYALVSISKFVSNCSEGEKNFHFNQFKLY